MLMMLLKKCKGDNGDLFDIYWFEMIFSGLMALTFLVRYVAELLHQDRWLWYNSKLV